MHVDARHDHITIWLYETLLREQCFQGATCERGPRSRVRVVFITANAAVVSFLVRQCLVHTTRSHVQLPIYSPVLLVQEIKVLRRARNTALGCRIGVHHTLNLRAEVVLQCGHGQVAVEDSESSAIEFCSARSTGPAPPPRASLDHY